MPDICKLGETFYLNGRPVHACFHGSYKGIPPIKEPELTQCEFCGDAIWTGKISKDTNAIVSCQDCYIEIFRTSGSKRIQRAKWN